MTEEKTHWLLEEAVKARKQSYSPYSHYQVGAALLCESGTIYHGCNVENASYGATVCAERVAFLNAVSNGERRFEAIAIVGGKEELDLLCVPCGMCLQVMSEFVDPDKFLVLLGRPDKNTRIDTLSRLLPTRFQSLEK